MAETPAPLEPAAGASVRRHTRINREFYDRTAREYDRGCIFPKENRTHLRKIQRIRDLLELRDQDHVFELGTGTGIHAHDLLSRQPLEYTGLDLSLGMLALAAQRLRGTGRTQLLAGDGTRLPFADESFDGVYCSGTLHHFADPEAGIREMSRVLRRGRRLVVMEANILFVKNILDGLLKPNERMILRMRLSKLVLWARRQGLEVVAARHFLYTPPSPAALIPFYDWLDQRLEQVPALNRLSLMIYLVARKPL